MKPAQAESARHVSWHSSGVSKSTNTLKEYIFQIASGFAESRVSPVYVVLIPGGVALEAGGHGQVPGGECRRQGGEGEDCQGGHHQVPGGECEGQGGEGEDQPELQK